MNIYLCFINGIRMLKSYFGLKETMFSRLMMNQQLTVYMELFHKMLSAL